MGFEYQIETNDDDDWDDLPPEAVEGIKAGLEDIKAGRVYTHAEAMAIMENRLNQLRKKNG
jgi:predicted transcriptional regulator